MNLLRGTCTCEDTLLSAVVCVSVLAPPERKVAVIVRFAHWEHGRNRAPREFSREVFLAGVVFPR